MQALSAIPLSGPITADLTSASIVLDAVVFATAKHRHQKRKNADATPYIEHPLRVAKLVMDHGSASVVTVDVVVAALLHDTLEDTATTYSEITERFGERVAHLVAEVTDNKQLPRELRKQSQIERAAEMSPGAKIIKLADKYDNVHDLDVNPPTSWDYEHCAEYLRWCGQVVNNLRGICPVLEVMFDSVQLSKPEEKHKAAIRARAFLFLHQ